MGKNENVGIAEDFKIIQKYLFYFAEILQHLTFYHNQTIKFKCNSSLVKVYDWEIVWFSPVFESY